MGMGESREGQRVDRGVWDGSPALSPEEWGQMLFSWEAPDKDEDGRPAGQVYATGILGGPAVGVVVESLTADDQTDQLVDVPPVAYHALAALALHDQPFGFTQEDVDVLAMAGDEGFAGYISDGDHYAHLRSIAARIAALLPPPAPPE